MIRRFLLLLVLSLPASCGDLPNPFIGNPGATARRLAQPMAPVLAVAPPNNALLSDTAARELAELLATALQRLDVPAIVKQPARSDWRVEILAAGNGRLVAPSFSIQDPVGGEVSIVEGAVVSPEAWSAGRQADLNAAAQDAAPRIAAALSSIKVTRDRADPNNLYNRPAKVWLVDVMGAPGDGNASLTQQMRARLSAYGAIVQSNARAADFVLRGEVVVAPGTGRQERVEIQWILLTPDGDERARIVQLNEIPAGMLDRNWGDIAAVVAAEAAGGVHEALQRQSGREVGGPIQPR